MRPHAIGTILLFPLLFCGCSSKVAAMTEIPPVLTASVPEPDTSAAATNGDLLELLLDYQLALRVCNGKLSSIGTAYGQHGDR